MKKYIVLAASVLMISAAAFAQEEPEADLTGTVKVTQIAVPSPSAPVVSENTVQADDSADRAGVDYPVVTPAAPSSRVTKTVQPAPQTVVQTPAVTKPRTVVNVETPSANVTVTTKQKEKKEKTIACPNAVGFYAFGGNTCLTYGLDFQRWIGRAGLELTGAGYWNPSATTDYLGYNVSAQVQLKLYELIPDNFFSFFNATLYTWAMIGVNGTQTQTYGSKDSDGNYQRILNPMSIDLTGGFGLGVDFIYGNHLSIPVTIGFAGQYPDKGYVSLCAGSGIRFRY